MPVPTVTQITWRLPRPAPHCHSPSAAASASFSIATVRPKWRASRSTGLQPRHSARNSTEPISPLNGSTGPVQPMPMPHNSTPARARADSSIAATRTMAASNPPGHVGRVHFLGEQLARRIDDADRNLGAADVDRADHGVLRSPWLGLPPFKDGAAVGRQLDAPAVLVTRHRAAARASSCLSSRTWQGARHACLQRLAL